MREIYPIITHNCYWKPEDFINHNNDPATKRIIVMVFAKLLSESIMAVIDFTAVLRLFSFPVAYATIKKQRSKQIALYISCPPVCFLGNLLFSHHPLTTKILSNKIWIVNVNYIQYLGEKYGE